MDKPKKIYLFVDGSNLYAGQYELFGPKKYLDFGKLIEQIEEKLEIKFSRTHFYASYSPKQTTLTTKVKNYLKNEALFYANAKKLKNLIFFKGYRSPTSQKEKEVDVKLAVDIVDYAHLNLYDELFLFSGDADFTQAINVAVRLKKKISILAIQNRIPFRFTCYYRTHIIVFQRTNPLLTPRQKMFTTLLGLNQVEKQELIRSI